MPPAKGSRIAALRSSACPACAAATTLVNQQLGQIPLHEGNVGTPSAIRSWPHHDEPWEQGPALLEKFEHSQMYVSMLGLGHSEPLKGVY